MKSFRDRNPYAVGIVSVLLLGAFTGVAFGIGLFHLLEKTYTVTAEFADASGLKTGDEVKIAGVKIGRVTGIEAERERGTVVVEFVVNQGVEIHDEANATIALETLLGSKYIRITNAMEGTTTLEQLDSEGDAFIPFERAGDRVPFDIFTLTRIATEGIQELDTDSLNDFINDLADVTDGRQQSITDLINGIERVSTAISERDVQLDELLRHADQLSATLAEKDDTLVALIDESRVILDLIANRRDELAAALGSGADAVTELADLISRHEVELDRILTTLHPTLDVVRSNLDGVNASLLWAGPGFYSQGLAGSHGPWLDIFVRGIGPDIAGVLCQLLTGQGPSCV